MSTVGRIKPVTFDDFCFLVKDGQKADLIDGVIYMASPDNTDANDLFVWLITLFFDFAEWYDLGKVYGSRVAFRVNNINSPEPDIGFVRKKRLHRVKRGHVVGGPDLAVEIVSPDSIDRDYVRKRLLYEKAGVKEYWIVDESEQKVTLLRLDRSGKYREVRPRKGILRSKVLPGFWLRPAWLWEEPRPRKSQVFQQILAGQD
jgi:Uma2 family endonuclease